MSESKILIVEDDETLLEVLKYNLGKEGYGVITATDGATALGLARQEKPVLVLLDIMLPVMNGLEVCRIIRKEMNMPIIMLTAKVDEVDKIVGLELGADDYITKPFSVRELIARVRTNLRRSEMFKQEQFDGRKDNATIYKVKNLEINITSHKVLLKNKEIELNHKEFELLALLVKNKGQVFERNYLLEKIWGYEYAGDTRTIDVHMRWLRQKLEADPSHPEYLITVRGVGYKFEE
jgi:DNA-binding response OmpR family regulator